jgi:cell division protein FtsA
MNDENRSTNVFKTLLKSFNLQKNILNGEISQLLKNIDKLTSYHTGMEARIGRPIEKLAHGYPKELESPIYSTGIGLLLKAANTEAVTSLTGIVSEFEFPLNHSHEEAVETSAKEEKTHAESHSSAIDSETKNQEEKPKKPTVVDGWMSKLKDFFEATDDSQL